MDQIRKSAKKDEIATAMAATMRPFVKLLQQPSFGGTPKNLQFRQAAMKLCAMN